jgi:D-aminoacyl-tRNA deacylase
MSRFIIVYSEKDPAGMNIAQHLKGSGLELFMVHEDIVCCDKELQGIGAKSIIFASRHRSEKGQPCFTVHPIGNWGKAEKGGKDGVICSSMPIQMKQTLINMNGHPTMQNFKDKGWKVSMEVTHHGPLSTIPCFFAEIGSSEHEWSNEGAGRIVADAIIQTINMEKKRWKVCFGAGGGHYAPKFNPKVLDNSDAGIAFAHILPDYYAETVEFETFKQATVASDAKIECVLMDWKGLKKVGRDRIVGFSNQAGITVERA